MVLVTKGEQHPGGRVGALSAVVAIPEFTDVLAYTGIGDGDGAEAVRWFCLKAGEIGLI